MSDPTSSDSGRDPAARHAKAADAKTTVGPPRDTKAADGESAATKPTATKPTATKPGGTKSADSKSAGDKGGEKVGARKERRRSLVTTLLSIFAVLVVLVAFGFFSGLGPLGRLSQRRDLQAPETLGGLSRITDQQIRERLELDRAAEALSQNNNGETSVEAYGDVTSDTGLFVVIALRGKIDVNRVVADSGATADQVQKVGTATCTAQADDIITCYRTSNTLTVMVRNSTGKAGVDKVAPITDEAFKSFG